jgi:hypothetical protein
MGLLTRDFFFQSYCLVFFAAPSLTRGRVCHVSVLVIEVYHSLVYLQQYLHLHYKCTHVTHNEYNIYRLCTADYALFTGNSVYHGCFITFPFIGESLQYQQVLSSRAVTSDSCPLLFAPIFLPKFIHSFYWNKEKLSEQWN